MLHTEKYLPQKKMRINNDPLRCQYWICLVCYQIIKTSLKLLKPFGVDLLTHFVLRKQQRYYNECKVCMLSMWYLLIWKWNQVFSLCLKATRFQEIYANNMNGCKFHLVYENISMLFPIVKQLQDGMSSIFKTTV